MSKIVQHLRTKRTVLQAHRQYTFRGVLPGAPVIADSSAYVALGGCKFARRWSWLLVRSSRPEPLIHLYRGHEPDMAQRILAAGEVGRSKLARPRPRAPKRGRIPESACQKKSEFDMVACSPGPTRSRKVHQRRIIDPPQRWVDLWLPV